MLSRSALVLAPVACSTKAKKVVSRSGTTTFKRHLLPKAAVDYRRLQRKAALQGPADPDLFIYPNERLGTHYALNISLNRNHKLTPSHDAFRNLHLRHLLMYGKGSVDKSRSLSYTPVGVAGHETFWVAASLNPKMQAPSTAKVADAIGESKQIFVEDAGVGSHRLAEVKTRVITTDANVAVIARHTLVPTNSTRADPVSWPFEVTVMVCSDLQLSTEQLAEFGLKSNSFALLHPERGLALVSGTNASAHVKNAIVSLASSRMANWSVPSALLNTAHVVAAGSNVGLVFDPSGVLSNPKNADLVSGFDGAVWNDYGTFRLWNSLSHSDATAPRNFGDLVEKVGNASAVTQSVKKQPIQYAHPNAVVFLYRDESGVFPGVARIASNLAAQLYSIGFTGSKAGNISQLLKNGSAESVGTSAKLFASLLDTHQTPIFVVNTRRKDGSELSAEDVRAVVNSALDGSLAKEKGVADQTLKMAVIGQVKGVKASLDPLKGFKDRNEYSAAAKALAGAIGIDKL